jgi:protein associated with RNAse G/E
LIVDIDIPDFVTRLNRLLYTARVSGVDFGLDVKTLTGKNIITEIDNFVNKTLRVKFPKEVKNILNEKRISNKKIVEMQEFIEKSKEYKNLTKVGEEYQPYLRNMIIFFPVSVLTSSPKSTPLTLAV